MDEELKRDISSVEDTQKNKYMTFLCDGEYYGISISYVNEITGMQQITEVPETESYIRGLVNLRGKIIPVIDVRTRLNKESLPYNDRTCIIVSSINNEVIGLIVDAIAEVVTIAKKDIVDPPSTEFTNRSNRYISGIGKMGNDVKLLIDLENLLYGN